MKINDVVDLSLVVSAATQVYPGDPAAEFAVHATIENTGAAIWLQSPGEVGHVNLGAHLFTPDGTLVNYDFLRFPLGTDTDPMPPGATVEVAGDLPHLEPGNYRVVFDLVAENVAWFADNGNPTISIDVSR